MNALMFWLPLAATTLAVSLSSGCQRAPGAARPGLPADQEAGTAQTDAAKAGPPAPAAPGAAARPGPPPSSADTGAVDTMRDELRPILSSPLMAWEEVLLVRRVRDSGRKELVPDLIEVARECSRDPGRRQAGMEALHGANVLEDIRAQLEKFALDYQANPGLAAHAILILARDPGPRTMEIVKKIPVDEQPERGALLPLRRRYNTFANFRPVYLPPELAHFSPLKPHVV